jgi:hypothetical protein
MDSAVMAKGTPEVSPKLPVADGSKGGSIPEMGPPLATTGPIPAGDIHEMSDSRRTFANNHARRYHELRAALKADFMTE